MLCSFAGSSERLPYARVLKEDDRCIERNEGLFFRCELQSTGALKFHRPDAAIDKRIYRMYGSNRFLEVAVPLLAGESKREYAKRIREFFSKKIKLCGRLYAYFWCKKEKTPQAYILFAEKGGSKVGLQTRYGRKWNSGLNVPFFIRFWNQERPRDECRACSFVLHSSHLESQYNTV